MHLLRIPCIGAQREDAITPSVWTVQMVSQEHTTLENCNCLCLLSMGAYDTLADREHTMIIDNKITILPVG